MTARSGLTSAIILTSLLLVAACSPQEDGSRAATSSFDSPAATGACRKLQLSVAPRWLHLTQAERTPGTGRFVYEDEEAMRSVALLSGIPGELPALDGDRRREGRPVGADLLAVRVEDGPVTFILVWDAGDTLCQPAVVVASGPTPAELTEIEASLTAS